MEYLLKSSALIVLFYLIYKTLLEKETFFQTNRFYLIGGLLTAICIPSIVIPIYVEYTPSITENTGYVIDANQVKEAPAEIAFGFWQLIYVIYGIGLVFFSSKLLLELASLKLLFKRHSYQKNGSYVFVETNADMPPFSFFNWIAYNPEKYSNEELSHILNHEKVHANELHSVDIILTELTCILLWFNPFIWLYKKDVQQNLEFIADKKAHDFSECKKSYQLILLKSSTPKLTFSMANNFYNSQIKKRIIMLQKSKSNKMNAWKYLLTIPILGLFLMGFNTEKVFIEIDEPTDLGNVAQSKASTQLNNFYESIVLDDITTNKAPTKQTKASTTKSTNKESSKLPEDISTTLINKNTSDTELDNITKRLKKEGLTVKFKGVKRNKNGEITAIKITAKSKNSNASYNVNSDEAIDTIKIIYDEDNNSISIGNGKARHDKNTFVHETQEGGKYKIQKSGSGSNVFLISDEDVELNEGDKGETKIIVRGKGKNGKVKKIKRSKNIEVISGDDDTVEIIVDGEGNDEKEVIIVNGKVEDFTEEEDKVIVKGNSIWVSKSDDNDEDITIIKSNKHKNKIFISGDNGKDPLYIIDGKEVPKEKITDLDPDKIESMTVLKDKSAVEKYGDKGKNGVIIIKTKKN